ncbi:MAG: enoyl-CoA hydratase/isomerase family protein [Gemmatimonadetes bacterium]|nr:enoyl-CoA hydratase/isomerase family protein [Gemmatimonadota bacterium]
MAEGAFSNLTVGIESQIGTITLNRPDRLNAFTVEMVDELTDALRMLTQAAAVRVIVVTGAGRGFCAGADIGVLKALVERGDEATGRRLVDGARTVGTLIREAPQPVIASLNGVAAGGGANLALACDLRIAAEGAKLGQVFVRLGLHPDWGGTYFLPRLVGTARALELFLSGELVGADRALELGLVNRVVPAERLAEATREWARQIALAPPAAVRRVKRAVYRSARATLEEMLDDELEAQLICFGTADFREGLAAFDEKREPHFTGR